MQTPATRLIVDRERERMAFVSASYWDIDALALPNEAGATDGFTARLARVDDARSPAVPTSTTAVR